MNEDRSVTILAGLRVPVPPDPPASTDYETTVFLRNYAVYLQTLAPSLQQAIGLLLEKGNQTDLVHATRDLLRIELRRATELQPLLVGPAVSIGISKVRIHVTIHGNRRSEPEKLALKELVLWRDARFRVEIARADLLNMEDRRVWVFADGNAAVEHLRRLKRDATT